MKVLSVLFVLVGICGVVLSVPTILVKNSHLYVDGVEFVVKGVNYSPAPLGQVGMSNGYGGTGFCSAKLTPWSEWKSACYDSDYYDGSTDINPARFPRGFQPIWERDFPQIRSLGANTIRLYNTNPSTRAATIEYTNLFPYPTGKDHTQFMKYCELNGFMVVYPLFTDEWNYDNLDEYTFKRYLRWQIDEVGNSSALLMWQFGNEMSWFWYGTSTWNDATATAKFNKYIAYIKRYTLSKWGRSIPVTTAIPNFQDQYTYQYQNWHVDIFSANVFFTNFDGLFAGNGGNFLGVSQLSCIYNKPFLMTEIGPTWAPGVQYTQNLNNEIWANVVKNMPYGLLGAIFFELTDEPAIGKDFGLFSLSSNTVNGVSSTAADGFVPDAITPKIQYWDMVQGTYNGVGYNMPANMYTLMGRTQTYFNNVTDRCAGMGLYACPGRTYPKCSGNGICDRSVGTCTCDVGWTGSSCSTPICPKSATGTTCSGRGLCSTVVSPPECACNYGYYGAACEMSVPTSSANNCPNGCSVGSGVCNQTSAGDWICMCHPGWVGVDCSIHDVGVGSLNIQQNFVGCLSAPSLSVTAPAPATPLTNQKCRYYCAMRNYMYSGTSAGNKCMCGNSLASTSTSSCIYGCAGDLRQACGGSSAVSTYVTGQVSRAGYLGCFIDDASRDLPVPAAGGGSLTIDACRQTCATQGYKYAGLQYSSYCFCGNSYGNKGGRVADTDCSSACAGDSTFMCGGGYRNSIYTATLPVGYSYY